MSIRGCSNYEIDKLWDLNLLGVLEKVEKISKKPETNNSKEF